MNKIKGSLPPETMEKEHKPVETANTTGFLQFS